MDYLWKYDSYYSNLLYIIFFFKSTYLREHLLRLIHNLFYLLLLTIIFTHFSNWSGRVKQLILKLIQVIGWLLGPLQQPIVLFRRLYLERRGKEENPLGWQNATDLELKPLAQILVNIFFETLLSRILHLSFS